MKIIYNFFTLDQLIFSKLLRDLKISFCFVADNYDEYDDDDDDDNKNNNIVFEKLTIKMWLEINMNSLFNDFQQLSRV